MKRLFQVVVLFLISSYTHAQIFSFEGREIGLNSKQDIVVNIGDTDEVQLPITIINGGYEGPVLGIIAGIHGYEYPPIMAVQNIIQNVNPDELRGTLLIVNIANVPSFLGRRINVNPLDNKNLNRNFPGNEKGTISEQMTAFISNKIIKKCDFLVDIHAGDAHEDLIPYAGYYNYFSNTTLSEKGKEMALAMNFPYVVAFGNEDKFEGLSLYTSREGISQNIPSVDIECGGLGIVEEEKVKLIENAIDKLMVFLKIKKGITSRKESVIIDKRVSITSNYTGIFYSDVKAGDFIKKGDKIGYITDFFGNKLEDVYSSTLGIVLYKLGTPPVTKGEQLFNIGIIYL